MANIATKFIDSLLHEGLSMTIKKVVGYLFLPLLKRRKIRKWDETLKLESAEEKFNEIYRKNLWGSMESVSGSGSTLRQTENLRKELPKLIEFLSIKKIFDAPCGDFNWMRVLLPNVDVSYVGADIVKPLIDAHKETHGNEKTSFLHLDLTHDDFPIADLMICRDCLFHLSYNDTKSVLKNFVESGIPYLLTTTHKSTGDFLNKDIATGDFRLIDLFSAPYNFPSNTLASIDDGRAPELAREMCLWSREQVSTALKQFH